jgi:hypothetical protein
VRRRGALHFPGSAPHTKSCCCHLAAGTTFAGSSCLSAPRPPSFPADAPTHPPTTHPPTHPPTHCRTIDGAMDARKRGQQIEEFKADPPSTVFLLTAK